MSHTHENNNNESMCDGVCCRPTKIRWNLSSKYRIHSCPLIKYDRSAYRTRKVQMMRTQSMVSPVSRLRKGWAADNIMMLVLLCVVKSISRVSSSSSAVVHALWTSWRWSCHRRYACSTSFAVFWSETSLLLWQNALWWLMRDIYYVRMAAIRPECQFQYFLLSTHFVLWILVRLYGLAVDGL